MRAGERSEPRAQGSPVLRLTGAKEQDGDPDAVLDAGCGSAQEKIAQKAVAVGAHRDQIAAFIFDPLDDLVRGLSIGEFRIGGNISVLQLRLNVAEIGGVVDNFLTDGVRAIGSGGPSIRDMQQDQAAVRELRQLLYVFNDGAVGWGAIESHKDFVVHGFLFGSNPEGAPSLSRILRQGGDFDFPVSERKNAVKPHIPPLHRPPLISCQAVFRESGRP